jgi:golgi SNAP receptor complex member 2
MLSRGPTVAEDSTGSSFSSEFPKAQRLMLTLRKALSDLERIPSGSVSFQEESNRSSLEKELSVKSQSLSRDVQYLSVLLDRESRSDPRAQQWRHRLDQLSSQVDEIRMGFEKYLVHHGISHRMDGTRERLLGDSAGELHRRVRTAEAGIAERDSLGRSLQHVDEMNEMGNAVFKNLREQRTYIKNAHRKALDFINVTGLSKSLIGLIERRNLSDQKILFGGMILTLLIIGIMYYLFRS